MSIWVQIEGIGMFDYIQEEIRKQIQSKEKQEPCREILIKQTSEKGIALLLPKKSKNKTKAKVNIQTYVFTGIQPKQSR